VGTYSAWESTTTLRLLDDTRESESGPEYFGISNIENPVFDRRDMDVDIPSQVGREDVPS